ncbi:hypothetical protein BH23ACT6_BH23ACT6_08880 [soil metagenome]
MSYYYDHATNWVTNDAIGPILTAPGDYQEELGCGGDWMPDCMRPWLQDADGDGTYTWSTNQIPAGNYEFKVARGLSWDESYGDGDGGNIAPSVPANGIVVTISYETETHEIAASTSQPGVSPDLSAAKAYWLSQDLIAVPPTDDEALTSWRLHTSADGGLSTDAETLTGGESAALTLDPDGVPTEIVERFPRVESYTALRLDRQSTKAAKNILRGQVAVASYDDLGRLVDATGVQTPGVLDELYSAKAADATCGVNWKGYKPQLRVWAPTAQKVEVVLWDADAADDAAVDDAQRIQMQQRSDGSWKVAGEKDWKNKRYVYAVTVFVPQTGHVETNYVTDPYSTALTLNSTKSVIMRMDDPAYQPEVWRESAAPEVAREVDQSIYELHVRDFSRDDPDVPAELRGSYLAFAENGYGRRHLADLADAGLNTVHLLQRLISPRSKRTPSSKRSRTVTWRHTRPRARSSRHASPMSPARTPSTGATTRGTSPPQRGRMPPPPRPQTAVSGWPSSGPWSARCTNPGCASCWIRSSTTPQRPVRLINRCSTRPCPATTTG